MTRFASVESYFGPKPEFDVMGTSAMEEEALNWGTAASQTAKTLGAGLQAGSIVGQAEAMAPAIVAGGQAAGQASVAGGIGSLASSFASPIANMFKGGSGGGGGSGISNWSYSADLPSFSTSGVDWTRYMS